MYRFVSLCTLLFEKAPELERTRTTVISVASYAIIESRLRHVLIFRRRAHVVRTNRVARSARGTLVPAHLL